MCGKGTFSQIRSHFLPFIFFPFIDCYLISIMFVIYAGQNDGKYIYPYVLQKTLMRRATVYNDPDYVSEQKIMEFRKERTRRASLEG